ncbi:MAG: HEAT repeat domain-containing protein [Gemmatimonadota bacterium]|nr:HEAT repeat domain-containing protein [Gemmatimonadota bacterium]
MSAVDVLAGSLPGALLRATLLITAVTVAAPLLRRARPEIRHALWGTALAVTVFLVVVAPLAPRLAVVLPGEVAPAFVPPALEEAPPIVAERAPELPTPSERPTVAAVERNDGGLGTLRRAAGLAWLLGVAIVAAWFVGRRAILARAAARARAVEDPETRERLRRLSDRLGIGELPRLLRGGVSVPVAWGTLRPTILLPEASLDWAASRLDAVLLHELAHLRRRDPLVQDVARLACVLHWYNPLVWRARNRLRAEAEAVCDGIVLEAGVPPAGYAAALVATLEDAVAGVGPAGVTLASGTELEERVRAVLKGPPAHAPRGRAAAVAIAVLVAGVMAGSATVVRGGPEPARQDPVVAALVHALGDEASFVRRSAINALRDIGDPDGIAAIRPLVDDPDPDVRRAAEEVLGLRPAQPNLPVAQARPPRLEGPELEAAIGALEADDPRARQRAAGRLQAARDPGAVAALVAAFADPDEHVRRQAAESLGWIADPAAVSALIDATRDPDAHVRQSAVGALGAIGRGPDEASRPGTEAAARADSPAVRPTPAPESGESDRPRTSSANGPVVASRAPNDCGPPAAVLAGLDGATVPEEIRALLVEPDADRRTRAAWSLGGLVTAEKSGPAVIADKHADPKDAREALTIAVYDPHRPVRLAAACSLARIGDDRALEHLERRTRDPETSIAEAAAWAIARIRGRTSAGG